MTGLFDRQERENELRDFDAVWPQRQTTAPIHKYVPLSQIELYYCQGWFIASILGPPHGFYSVLMELRID